MQFGCKWGQQESDKRRISENLLLDLNSAYGLMKTLEMLRHSTNRAKYGKTEFIHNMNLFDYRSLDIVFLSSLRIKDVGEKKQAGSI